MAHIKLTTGRMIGDEWKEKGAVIEVAARLAELHIKAGTGVAVAPPQSGETAAAPPPIEQATIPPRGDKAVAPRQR